jgi:hypothetical protein
MSVTIPIRKPACSRAVLLAEHKSCEHASGKRGYRQFEVTNSGGNGPNARSPTGHASGGGASPTRSPGLPVRRAALRQRGLG